MDWKRWQDSDDEDEGKQNAWNLDGLPGLLLAQSFFASVYSGRLDSAGILALKPMRSHSKYRNFRKPCACAEEAETCYQLPLPGLGDMNFGDMGADAEYDSDDEAI